MASLASQPASRPASGPASQATNRPPSSSSSPSGSPWRARGELRNPADSNNFDQGSDYYRFYRRLLNMRDLWWDSAFACLGDGPNGTGLPQHIECVDAEGPHCGWWVWVQRPTHIVFIASGGLTSQLVSSFVLSHANLEVCNRQGLAMVSAMTETCPKPRPSRPYGSSRPPHFRAPMSPPRSRGPDAQGPGPSPSWWHCGTSGCQTRRASRETSTQLSGRYWPASIPS